MVLLVDLPPDVVGRDVLVTSDPFVSVVQCFSCLLWLTIYIYIYMGSSVDYSITILDCRALSFSCDVVPLELGQTPVVGVPLFLGGSTVEA